MDKRLQVPYEFVGLKPVEDCVDEDKTTYNQVLSGLEQRDAWVAAVAESRGDGN